MIFEAFAPSLQRRLLRTKELSQLVDPLDRAKLFMDQQFQIDYIMDLSHTRNAKEDPWEQRRLQESLDQEMVVNYENCVFEGNQQGDTADAGIPLFGIVSILTQQNPTTFTNCTFKSNTYDGSDGSVNGYAIQSIGSALTLWDNCFEDNSFIGFGPVQVFADASLESSSNFASDDDDNALLFCSFVAFSTLFIPESKLVKLRHCEMLE